MSIWQRIADAIAALANGEGLTAVFDKLRAEPEKTVAFTIAVIALGAKMAKADGLVTRGEVSAFREVFTIPPEDEDNAARVFNLARQDVAGFDSYARKIAAMFDDRHDTLFDLMEGLFHIAVADDNYHDAEDQFLSVVARIFGMTDAEFRTLRARYVPDADHDPYFILGATPDMSLDDVRALWRELVRETHPDRMMARGVPEEAIKMAEKRLVQINRAWEEISEKAA
ncbi:molecular chaperone DjiA [uncultured Litoreibacter sp.]|uniref:molecular chaperone DjiA n=1 Tax=uncultured Litoreibacter sp. TaxID=1392394 RepID=UPI002615DC71|nr:molecular chaperone DjiA [uncultured Litoreibacter sp.]